MLVPPADSIQELVFPASTGTGSSAKPSQIECEVIDLFQQFRNPLVRYVMALGLSVHDAVARASVRRNALAVVAAGRNH
jgi:hypothetical protein